MTECARAAALYFYDYDWPCSASGYLVWTIAGEAADAIDLPRHHAKRVFEAVSGSRAVIDIPGPIATWRFLSRPRKHPATGLVRKLRDIGGRYLHLGDRIDLPPTRVPSGELTWIERPDGALPSVNRILDAI